MYENWKLFENAEKLLTQNYIQNAREQLKQLQINTQFYQF